ncbi:MAG TPA: hypothetical protein VEX37_01155 [Thermomicrobiales bacterium]|nr:hypothetical protein [Thermomicrobiales bacterium]
MFDRLFFSTILPEHVRAEVAANPGKVPIIELYLTGGAVLDLCHVVRLADTWVAVAHFCREDVFDDADIAFLPYGTIMRVALTMRDKAEREIGFSMTKPPLDAPAGAPVPASLITPAVAEPIEASSSEPTR